MKPSINWLELVEHQPKWLPSSTFSEEIGLLLWQRYSKQLEIEFPNRKTNFHWKLRSRGWVGSIPLSKRLGLWLLPQVSMTHFYTMFAYVYGEEWPWQKELSQCDTIPTFYKQLAQLLIRKMNERLRRGLYRQYHRKQAHRSAIRGRIDFQQMIRQPSIGKMPCQYQEQTVDHEDNQILLWTLHMLSQSRWCSDQEIAFPLRQAYRMMKQSVSLKPFTSADCRRTYHRLNQDYLLLHSLCRFFLDHRSPVQQKGEEWMLPFCLHMATLYERFVTAWLRRHLPRQYRLSSQEVTEIGENAFSFRLDLVVYQGEKARSVLDIKYKQDRRPQPRDLMQIIAYAYAKGCKEAVLVYPTEEIEPFDEYVQQIRVRTLAFPLVGDLEKNGQRFLEEFLCSFAKRKAISQK